jgi:hypothetical protein
VDDSPNQKEHDADAKLSQVTARTLAKAGMVNSPDFKVLQKFNSMKTPATIRWHRGCDNEFEFDASALGLRR